MKQFLLIVALFGLLTPFCYSQSAEAVIVAASVDLGEDPDTLISLYHSGGVNVNAEQQWPDKRLWSVSTSTGTAYAWAYFRDGEWIVGEVLEDSGVMWISPLGLMFILYHPEGLNS